MSRPLPKSPDEHPGKPWDGGNHGKTLKACKRCNVFNGRWKRIFVSYETRTPIGTGNPKPGELCPDCETDHPHGTGCEWKGLRRSGWTVKGVQESSRKPAWSDPARVKRRMRRELKRASGIEEVPEISNLKKLPVKRVQKDLDVPDIIPSDITSRLDASTQELWLRTADALSFGLKESQIAHHLNLSEDLVRRLTGSPTFQAFYSSYKLVRSETMIVRERLGELVGKSIDALKWIIESRDLDNMNAIRGASVDVLKLVLNSREGEGKGSLNLHLHTTLPEGKEKGLEKALRRLEA